MNKKTYKLQDGGTITATCSSDFVTQFRKGSRFDSECTDTEYMNNFAERYKQYSGKTIRTDTPDNFLEDILKYKYAEII